VQLIRRARIAVFAFFAFVLTTIGSSGGCNPGTQDIADCINVPTTKNGGQNPTSRTVSLDEILKIKQHFEDVEAVQFTRKFQERFDKLNEPLEVFLKLYNQAIDAETGRDPWKLDEAPGWFTDPVGRFVFNYNAQYEGVAKSIRDFELPHDMFVFRADWSSDPEFLRQWNTCDLKAAETLIYDIGRLESILSVL
jgi:hypothetical protein